MRLSRSKIELYNECPRCFYFDVVLKKSRPSNFPLNLNNAVDILLKREFDHYREKGISHPVQNRDAQGFLAAKHTKLNSWRDNRMGGLAYYNKNHDCTYFGIIDDLWVNGDGQFAVVDYKSTAKAKPVLEIPTWAINYKRQLSFYSYLLKKNELEMFDKGFLLYSTAITSEARFDDQLKFSTNIIIVDIEDDWIESTLDSIQNIIQSSKIPDKSENCKYCNFIEDINSLTK